MAICPGCERELAGMETICRDCFEKQYVTPASKKKIGPELIVLFIGLPLLLLLPLYVPGVANALKTIPNVRDILLVGLAPLGIVLGIWASLQSQNTRDRVYWLAVAVAEMGLIMSYIQHHLLWVLLMVPFGLLRIGRAVNDAGIF